MPTPIGVWLDMDDSDHASGQWLAVGELSSHLAPGGSSGERDAPTRDLVGSVHDLGLVARLRVDEEEERGVACLTVDVEQRLVGCRAPCGARVGGSTCADSDRN